LNPIVEVRQRLESLIARGRMSEGEAREAMAFFDQLADRELRGEITAEQALDAVIEFGLAQVRRRGLS